MKHLPARPRLVRWMAAYTAFSLLDLLLTWLLLAQPGDVYEANPLAAAVLRRLGWAGLAAFKGALVAAVLALALAVHRRRAHAARSVLRLGCAILAFVLGYSLFLMGGQAAARSEDERTLSAQSVSLTRSRQECERLKHFTTRADELAAELAAGRLRLPEATAQLAAYLKQVAYDPSRYLNWGGPDSDARLAALLVRSVGWLVYDRPEETRQQLRGLRAAFAASYGELPAFALQPFRETLERSSLEPEQWSACRPPAASVKG